MSVYEAGELAGLGTMVLVAAEKGWAGLAARPMPRPMRTTAVGLRLAAASPGPCTALLPVPSTESAATPCTWKRTVRKKACSRPQVRTEALDTAVLVTPEEEDWVVGLVVVRRDHPTDRSTDRSTDCFPKVPLMHRPARWRTLTMARRPGAGVA